MTETTHDETIFALRLERSRDDLWGMLRRLYGRHPDYAAFRAALEAALRRAWDERPPPLRRLDLERDLNPDWFRAPRMVGYAFYADRFAGDLAGVEARLDYLASLGVTYIHVMPCLMPRPGDSDGGYSVMDYRRIDPRLGTMADFEALTAAARARGISVCIDMVLNHTAKEHAWARAAREGDPRHLAYYHTFADAALPEAYEAHLTEVFPETAPGSFTHYPEMGQGGRWVWTTFNKHQWDLNWANPWVFLEMCEIMLFLANRGADVLRFDAVAFMWKRMGTRCQSEPEVHMILHALRAANRIVSPATIHLEEAIVGPAEMLSYLGAGEHDGKEGNLAYHNSLMVQIWSALASRDTRLMRHVMTTHFPRRMTNATYATYLRCHDDIGWAVTDEDAGAVGVSGAAHRAFLSDFYEGAFPGSFARGARFGWNPATGDRRVSGTLASLAGLEAAVEAGNGAAVDLAVDRIVMGHALIASHGGVPLIYMGDEVAMLNDYDYAARPAQAGDSRWLHRPEMDWARVARAEAEPASPEGRVLAGLRHVMARRAALTQLDGRHETEVLAPDDPALYAVARRAPTGPLICVFNFAERWTGVPEAWLRAQGATAMWDALSEGALSIQGGWVPLPPYARAWIA
jgi:amylosucrase